MTLIIDNGRMNGKFVFDTTTFGWPVLRATANANGRAYLGYAAQDDLLALGKAILNAMEPEALVENQKAAEPEPYKPQVGDLVRVTAPQYVRNWGIGEHKIVEVYNTSATIEHPAQGRGAFPFDQLELVEAPAPEFDVPALAAAVNDLQDRIADLEAAADTEIRIGDTVRVLPEQWNIGGVFVEHRTITGEVTEIVPEDRDSRYLVRFTYPEGHRDAGKTTQIYASADIEKVNTRG